MFVTILVCSIGIYLIVGLGISALLHKKADMPRDLMIMMTVIWGIFIIALPFIGIYALIVKPPRKRPKLNVIVSDGNEEDFCKKVRRSWAKKR